MKFKISDIDANPFRHIERYPIREDKIAALRESITTTGFWDNIVGRKVGGRVQIAYGHHRREALLREYPPDHTIGIVVRNFTDEQMLQIMARENMEEWGSSAAVEIETIDAVVQAYGAGQIELVRPEYGGHRGLRESQVRFAPSFVLGLVTPQSRDYPYTAQSVAEFLGWTFGVGEKRMAQDKVHSALAALALIEQKHLSRDDFLGLSTDQAAALVDETRAALRIAQREAEDEARRAAALELQRRQAEERAREAAERQAEALERAKAAQEQAEKDRAERDFNEQRERAERAEQEQRRAEARAEAQRRENARASRAREQTQKDMRRDMGKALRGEGSIREARQTAQKAREKLGTPDGPPPELGRIARQLASQLSVVFTSGVLSERLSLVLGHRRSLDEHDRGQLIAGLQEARDAIDRHLKTLGAGAVPTSEYTDVIDGDVVDAEIV